MKLVECLLHDNTPYDHFLKRSLRCVRPGEHIPQGGDIRISANSTSESFGKHSVVLETRHAGGLPWTRKPDPTPETEVFHVCIQLFLANHVHAYRNDG